MKESLFIFLGGLALFLFGMQQMGNGLQRAAGDRMRNILEALTGLPAIGVLVGTIVTAIIQSSSATTVMVVGFVNAGLMTLKQSVGIIMGANIGTTVTAQLIAFKITNYIYPIIAVGFAIHFFAKKKSAKYIGQVFLGFGILMLGMATMGTAVAPLKNYQGFKDLMVTFGQNPMLGVGIGVLMTMIIQSSTATIGILMAMAAQGLVPIEAALPILIGDNIGTCITAVLSSIGTNLAARRAAAAHVLFNVLGAIVFILLMPIFLKFILYISPDGDIVRQIANAHTSFNVLNTLLWLPLISIFTEVVRRIVPGKEETVLSGRPVYLDERMLSAPGIALSLATKELIRMANLAEDNVKDAMEGFFQKDVSKLQQVFDREKVIDELETAIIVYLAKLAQSEMPPSLSHRHTRLLHAVNDIERVGDHAENIAQMAQSRIEEDLPFSDEAIEELANMHNLVQKAFARAIYSMQNDNQEVAREVENIEHNIDLLERELRKSHISRLNSGKCYPQAGVVFLDILSNLERVGDHSYNIAQVVLDEL